MQLIEVTKAFVSNCTTLELRSSNAQEAMTRIGVALIYERDWNEREQVRQTGL